MQPLLLSREGEIQELQQIFDSSEGALFFLLLWLWILFEIFLYAQQNNVFQHFRRIPHPLQQLQTPDMYERARLYRIDIIIFDATCRIIKGLIFTWMASSGGFLQLWKLTYPVSNFIPFWPPMWTQADQCTVIFALILIFLWYFVRFPFSMYCVFVLEEKHGFNRDEFWSCVWKACKRFMTGTAFICPSVGILSNFGVQWGLIASVFPLYETIFISFFRWIVRESFFYLFYFRFVNRIFETYYPLRPGPLRERIKALVEREGFPLKDIEVMIDSNKTTHPNHCLYGFIFNRHIVLYDTLWRLEGDPDLEPFTDEEIEAIVAFELGRWKCYHIPKTILLDRLRDCWVMWLFYCPYLCGSGVVVQALLGALYFVAPGDGPFLNFWLRRFVYKADAKAVEILDGDGEGRGAEKLKMALKKMARRNLEFEIWDPLYQAWFFGRPTLTQRLWAIEQLEYMSERSRRVHFE